MDIEASSPRLLLLRHGQIKANKTGHWHGSTDSALTFRGRRQAKRTGRYLKQFKLAGVYASPLQRCRHTAELATAHTDLDVEPLPDLQEMHIGDWEGLSFKALQEEHGLFQSLQDPDFRPPGGESLNDVAARVCRGIEAVSTRHEADDTVLIVSHGVAMGTALAQFLDQRAERWRDYHFDNCSLTEILVSPEPLVLSFNQTFHL